MSETLFGYLTPINDTTPQDDEYNIVFQKMVSGVTGIDPTLVRPRWVDEPEARPPGVKTNWAAVGVSDPEPLPGDIYLKPNEDGETSSTQKHWKLSVLTSFYGPSANYYAGVLADGLYIGQNLEQIAPFGIKLRNIGSVTKTAELVNTVWYGRADVTIDFVIETNRTYAVKTILTIPAPNIIPDTTV
jgi:hypothetical protein